MQVLQILLEMMLIARGRQYQPQRTSGSPVPANKILKHRKPDKQFDATNAIKNCK